MHAVGVLQRVLQDSIPSLHLNRLRALMSTVRSAMTTRRLTLSGLARGLPTGQAITKIWCQTTSTQVRPTA